MNEKSQPEKVTQCITLFIHSSNSKSIDMDNRLVVARVVKDWRAEQEVLWFYVIKSLTSFLMSDC